MKRLLIYLLPALLLASACSKEPTEDAVGGTGAMALQITTTRTAQSGDYDPLDYLTVRIYKGSGELIRKYTSRTDLPERLELLAGEYRIAVEAGESVPASFTQRFYKGEERFTVTAGQTTPVEVACKLQNSVVEVKFGEGIAANLGDDFDAWVMVAETFDENKIESGTTPVLHYTADAVGYFVLPEGCTTFSWRFRGEHAEKGAITKTGSMTDIKSPGKYTLTFTYKPDLPGYIESIFELEVDDSTDDRDDTIIFSPDPTIEGDGFDMKEVQPYLTGEKRFNISTVKPMTVASLLFGSRTYDLLEAATTPIEGITAEHPDENTLTVTLSDALFAGSAGGEQTLRFSVADNAGGTLTTDAVFRLQGILQPAAADCDLWNNAVTLRALVLDPAVTNVTFGLRTAEGEWQEVAGTQGNDGHYTATIGAEWEQSRNDAGLTVHTPVAGTGVFANNTYEVRSSIGSATSTAVFTTSGGDAIYNAGMELWSTYNVTGSTFTGGNVVYPNENSSKVFWVGSNNGNTKELCTGVTVDGNNGSKCAQLHPQAATGNNFAAGSLFTGSIDFGTGMFDMFGFARFGIQYEFTARPRALKVHYKAVITQVTHTGKSSLTTNDYDPARILVCITDWTGRHAVQSGVSFDESTFWDPVKASSLGEGPILGYGSEMITTSTDGWTELELPILWYDKDGAPAADRYSLVISCASSAYGDYMGGSLNNYLYVEDFEWVY